LQEIHHPFLLRSLIYFNNFHSWKSSFGNCCNTGRVKIRRINLLIRWHVFDFSVSANLWHNSTMEYSFCNFESWCTSSSKYFKWNLKLIFSGLLRKIKRIISVYFLVLQRLSQTFYFFISFSHVLLSFHHTIETVFLFVFFFSDLKEKKKKEREKKRKGKGGGAGRLLALEKR
jgi:hypothetical protein